MSLELFKVQNFSEKLKCQSVSRTSGWEINPGRTEQDAQLLTAKSQVSARGLNDLVVGFTGPTCNIIRECSSVNQYSEVEGESKGACFDKLEAEKWKPWVY